MLCMYAIIEIHRRLLILQVHHYVPFVLRAFELWLTLENGRWTWTVKLASQVTLLALTRPGLQQRKTTGIDSHMLFVTHSKLMTLSSVLLILRFPESFESVGLRHSSGVLLMFARFQRSLHSPVYSIWIPYGMGGFQPHSMDCIWTIFWLATQPFFHSIPTMESIWNPYGMDHSMDIPCSSPCGFLVDSMEFPMNLHCKSMYYSIWIPWNSPYGFHGRIHIKFRGRTINYIVKNSVINKN